MGITNTQLTAFRLYTDFNYNQIVKNEERQQRQLRLFPLKKYNIHQYVKPHIYHSNENLFNVSNVPRTKVTMHLHKKFNLI